MVYNMLKDLVPKKKCLKEKENGDFLVVSSNELDIYYLNDTAREIYILIDGERDINTITKELISRYEVSLEVLSKDVVYFIRDLQWKRLINLV